MHLFYNILENATLREMKSVPITIDVHKLYICLSIIKHLHIERLEIKTLHYIISLWIRHRCLQNVFFMLYVHLFTQNKPEKGRNHTQPYN